VLRIVSGVGFLMQRQGDHPRPLVQHRADDPGIAGAIGGGFPAALEEQASAKNDKQECASFQNERI